MLKRFLNPRWQHPDPEVRRQAVAALTWSEDADAIAQVAREDALPGLRRLALRQCLDLDLLHEQAKQDPDPEVCEQAQLRFREVMSGMAEPGLPLAQRLDRAARCDHPPLLEFLAREGKEDALREHALSRVTREAVLRDVALKDSNPELRLIALERIQDEAVLTRIYQQSRKSDKRISRRTRERLDALKELRERPQQVAEQCQQICTALGHLGRDARWNRDEGLLKQLEGRWQALEPHYRDSYAERFDAARTSFTERLAAVREAERPVREAMRALIERLEALLQSCAEDDEESGFNAQEHQSRIRAECAAWKRMDRLSDDSEQQELDSRFDAARQELEANISKRRQRSELLSLLEGYDKLAARHDYVAEADVKALEREREKLSAATCDATTSALMKRIDKANQKLRERLRKQAALKEKTLAELPVRLETLKAAVDEGRASDAVALHDAVAGDLEAVRNMGASTERVLKLQSQLSVMSRDVQVMRAWGRFGATRALEQLCEEMEALRDSEEHPQEVARKVHAARAAWKERSAKGPRVDQGLWKRFDAAASEAYLPCKTFFETRAKERKANLQRRQQLLEELTGFNASFAGGPDTDWKAAVRFRRQILNDWHRAHPVERKPGKALADGLDAQIAELDAVLGRERERCLRQREQLISEAQALAANSDKKAAAEDCKRLQRQWNVTVPGSRGQENALWEKFRGACDAVFAERQQVFDEQREGWKKALQAREALCKRIEDLLASSDAMEAERELHRVQGEWERCAPVPKRESDAVESRYTRARRHFAKHRRALQATARLADLELMRGKAALCQEAEALLHLQADARAPAVVEALRSRWQALPAVSAEGAEPTMAQRFQQAMDWLAGADGESTPSAGSLAANLETREALCLRMEILAGIESPPQYAQARMAQQVQRLASALKERSNDDTDTAEDLLQAWCVTGPAPPERVDDLEARFQRAWHSLTSSEDRADA